MGLRPSTTKRKWWHSDQLETHVSDGNVTKNDQPQVIARRRIRTKNAVCFLLGNSPASEFHMPTFRNTLYHLHRQVGVKNSSYLPACEDGTECSETSAYKIQTPGNYPEESIQHSEHGKSLKSRTKKFRLRPTTTKRDDTRTNKYWYRFDQQGPNIIACGLVRLECKWRHRPRVKFKWWYSEQGWKVMAV